MLEEGIAVFESTNLAQPLRRASELCETRDDGAGFVGWPRLTESFAASRVLVCPAGQAPFMPALYPASHALANLTTIRFRPDQTYPAEVQLPPQSEPLLLFHFDLRNL